MEKCDLYVAERGSDNWECRHKAISQELAKSLKAEFVAAGYRCVIRHHTIESILSE